MPDNRNVQLVKDAYAAFSRGDIPALLESLDENIEWEGVKGTEGVAPQAGLRRGKAAVAEFFALVASTTEFHKFEPREFIAGEDAVAVVGFYEATVKPTGRRVAADWLMLFNIRNGKIVRFREWTDSVQIVRAYGQ
jgi:ketosteroid isomerase-like protein